MADPAATAAAPPLGGLLLRAEAEAFLHREADLLDAREFDAWVALFAEDATYWVPGGAGGGDPSAQVSIVYDRLPQIRERVWRLGSGMAYAQEPPSRTSRLIGNVVAEPTGDGISVRSRFAVREFRRDARRTYAGRCRHELRRTAAGIEIVLKKVELVDADGHHGNLSILL
jgi:3-phenylpropionate/cinnamic acid dioxygenase small subunit